MRLFLIIVSTIVIAVFGIAFVFTFAGRGWIEDKGRSLLIEKTQAGADTAAEYAEKALENDLVGDAVSENFRKQVRAEIADYREDPTGFIRKMTSKERSEDYAPKIAPPTEEDAVEPEKKGLAGFFSKVSKNMAEVDWKEKIRQHYNKSLNALIKELRIFSGTNIMAGAFGLLLAWKSRETARRVPLLIASGILLLSLVSSIWMYISDFSVFDVIWNSYPGWGYPALLFFMFAYLYFKGGMVVSTAKADC